MNRTQLRALSRARLLPHSRLLGCLTPAQLDHCLSVSRQCISRNALRDNLLQRHDSAVPIDESSLCVEHYAQANLRNAHRVDPDARDQSSQTSERLAIAALESVVGRVDRVRITRLDAAAELPKHIDDPSQRRVICLLAGQDQFRITTRDERVTVSMAPGEVWFVNTAWPHQVVNIGRVVRVAIIADLVEVARFEENLKLSGSRYVIA